MQRALPRNCLCMCHPEGVSKIVIFSICRVARLANPKSTLSLLQRTAGAILTRQRDDAGCPQCVKGSQPDTFDKAAAAGPNTDATGDWPEMEREQD